MAAGQISQTADQQSAVNGAAANVANIALRNVHLQAMQTGAALPAGQTVELMFVAANISPDVNDKLVSITSDVGTVALTGVTAIPAGTSLIVGSADGQAEATPLGSASSPRPRPPSR